MTRRRWRRLGALISLIFMVGGFILICTCLLTRLRSLRFASGIGDPLHVLCYLIILFLLTSPALMPLLFMRARFRQAIREEMNSLGYQTCLKCGYPLRGQDRARCPECGALSFELIREIGIDGLGLEEDAHAEADPPQTTSIKAQQASGTPGSSDDPNLRR